MKKFIRKFKYEIIVFTLFVLSRLPSLGHDMFNTDVWKWKARSYDFGSGVFGLDFERTLQKYHPGVTLMWIGSAGIKFFNLYYSLVYKTSPRDNSAQTIFQLHFVQKFFVVIVIGLSLVFFFYPLKKLFGVRYALLTVAFLSLDPFYIALSREFHLEGLMSTFMIASVIWLYYYFDDKSKKFRFILSAFFGSLAFLTKTSSLFLVPFTGLSLFLFGYHNDKNFMRNLRTAFLEFLKWFLMSFAFFFAAWPAMWAVPIEVFKTLYRGIFVVGVEREHIQYYFGRLVENPGFTYYFVVLALRSSAYLIIGLVGYFLLARKHLDRSVRRFVLFMVIFSVVYIVELTIPNKKLDRYILPSIVGFTLVSAFFYEYILNKFRKVVFFPMLLFIPAIFTMVLLNPDYFSYYSPLFGGLKAGIYVIEPKWMIGSREVVEYFKKVQADEGFKKIPQDASMESLITTKEINNVLAVGFPEKYYTQIWPFFKEFGAIAVIKDLTPFAVRTKYFVYPVWGDDSRLENRFNIHFVGQIQVRGIPVYNVYKRI